MLDVAMIPDILTVKLVVWLLDLMLWFMPFAVAMKSLFVAFNVWTLSKLLSIMSMKELIDLILSVSFFAAYFVYYILETLYFGIIDWVKELSSH